VPAQGAAVSGNEALIATFCSSSCTVPLLYYYYYQEGQLSLTAQCAVCEM